MSFVSEYIQRSPYLLFGVQALSNFLHGRPFDHGAFKNAAYDTQLHKVMKVLLKPDGVCIDGGANLGLVLEQMCALAPEATHFAFEPIPHLYQQLIRTFPDQHIFDTALGDETGRASFKHVVNAPAYSGLRERNYNGQAMQVSEIVVKVARLDDLIPPGNSIAFIKLDLEGGEYHALRGGMRLIREQRPFIAFEAGQGSTGSYGVTPEMLWDLLVGELGLELSMMARWLNGLPRFSREEFLEAYRSEFFYLAYPPGHQRQ